LRKDKNLASAFVRADVDEYLYSLLPARDAVVREMEAYARKHNVPIIGPAVARLLALLAETSRARRIFEMGSAIGYSTVWLARAAGPKAEVFYTDGNPENARRAAGYFRRAGVANRIHILTGDALALLRKTPGTFDLIFNDVDKHQYPAALRIALPKLRRGGLFITDNTLWSGRVTRRGSDAETRGVQKFNSMVYSSRQLFPVLLPLRDGVTVCRKR
jgi:caffeoyl-CoA O-methyltransferase